MVKHQNPEDEFQRYANIDSYMALAANMSAMFYKHLLKEELDEDVAVKLTSAFVNDYLSKPLEDEDGDDDKV